MYEKFTKLELREITILFKFSGESELHIFKCDIHLFI